MVTEKPQGEVNICNLYLSDERMILILMFFDRLMTVWYQLEDCSDSLQKTYTQKKPILSNQTNQIKPPQPNCLNQSAITKPTQPYLPKQIYQTKFTQPNLKPKCIKPIYKIKSLNSNLSKQTYKTQLYQIKHTKTIWNFLHNFKNLFWVKLPHPSLFKDSIFRN